MAKKITFEPSKVDKIVEYLEGSCQTLSDACRSLEIEETDITEEEHEAITQEIFNCELCNWWYAQDENNGEEVCNGCTSEDVEED